MNLNWADNLRAVIQGAQVGVVLSELACEKMLEWVHTGERHIDNCLNTIEALAEANADLRHQLHELKAPK